MERGGRYGCQTSFLVHKTFLKGKTIEIFFFQTCARRSSGSPSGAAAGSVRPSLETRFGVFFLFASNKSGWHGFLGAPGGRARVRVSLRWLLPWEQFGLLRVRRLTFYSFG